MPSNMELTPPHSPPSEQHLSAKSLAQLHDREMFAKRPISPPLSSGETSDANSDDQHSHQPPVSLLTALLHSPGSQHQPHSLSRPGSSARDQSAYLSPHSSVPSTAVSSPNLKPGLGSQKVPAMSILRRDSVSSDNGDVPVVSQAHVPTQATTAAATTDTRVELPKRACSLKFAVAPPLKRRQAEADADAADVAPPVPKVKADVPQRSNTDETEPEESPVTANRENDDDLEEENAGKSGSEDSDLGYQEDSEQSDDDEERIRSGPKYPFARSTNYRRCRQEARSPSPPPAPAVLPPPSRRGRGHIRVDSSCISGKETEGGCSRHRSPPPSKSRSRSNSGERERIGRLSDAGPRQNRAGSPMPSRILEASSDEDEEESPLKPTPAKRGMGWRSDDAAFYGPKAQVKGIRAVSAPSAVISDEDEQDGIFGTTSVTDNDGAGVRSFFRRASEHLPAFRRPRPVEPPLPVEISQNVQAHAPATTPRAALPIHACPPALDNTPALANSIARVETNYSGGLAHRLEKTLTTRSSELHAHA